jgi:hypothetical protein
MEIDPFFADIPAVHCPNCGERFLRPEDLEVHRERHRPIPSKLKGSSRCPKGCGRCLVPDAAETQTHLVLCDGSPPLNGIPYAMKRKWYCAEHNFGTDGPKPWGWHKQEYHGGQDPHKPAKKMPEEPVGEEAVNKAIGLLEAERERLVVENAKTQTEIQRLDAALKVLKDKQPKPVEA